MNKIVFFMGLLAGAWMARADDKITYQQHVRPIFAERCLGCHNSEKLRGGLDLSAYPAALNGGSGGPVLAPGDPAGSVLFGVISHTREPKMPPSGAKLPDEAIELIRKWIAGGCLETPDGKPAEKKSAPNVAPVTATPAASQGAAVLPLGLPLAPAVVAERAGAVPALAAHPASPLVALAGQKQTLLYNTNSLQLLGILPFDDGFPNVLRFSRGGQALVCGGGTAGKSGHVLLWSVGNGERLAAVGEEFDAVRATDVDPKLRWIALGGPSKVVKIYALQGGALLHQHEKHTDWITDLAYSPDGILLATADRNGGLHIWEAESHALLHSPGGHPAAITSLDWRGDANILATACEDGQIRLFEMNGGGLVKAWGAHGGGALCVRWGRDGRLVSAGRDKTVKIWDQNGAQVRAFPALNEIALACAFDASGKRVIASDLNGMVRVWNAEDGNIVGELPTNPPPVAQQLEAAQQHFTQVQAEKTKREQELAAAQAAVNAATEQLKQTQQALDAAIRAAAAADVDVKKWQAGALRGELDAARATLAERENTFRPIGERAAASQKAAEKAAADVTEAKTRLETMPARIQELTSQVGAAQQNVEKAKAEHAAQTQLAQNRAATVAAYAGVVEQIKTQAAGLPSAPPPASMQPASSQPATTQPAAPLAQAVNKAVEALALLQQDADAARQAAEQAARAVAVAEEALKAAQEHVSQAQAEQAALPARIEELNRASQAAAAQAATEAAAVVEARKPVDEAAQRVAALKQEYEKLLAAARPAYEN